MPLKKGKKIKEENPKEKKAIATRLMVISLKIDDYIYKSKPITTQEAQNYIDEVAAHKLKCDNDVRSLQVIEKLTSFMKIIIKENSINIETETINSASNSLILPINTITPSNKQNVEGNAGDDVFNHQSNQNTIQIDEHNLNMMTLSNLSIDSSLVKISSDKEHNEENLLNKQDSENEAMNSTIVENNIIIKDFDETDVICTRTPLSPLDNAIDDDKEISTASQLTNTYNCYKKRKVTSKVNNVRDKTNSKQSNKKRKTKILKDNKEIERKVTQDGKKYPKIKRKYVKKNNNCMDNRVLSKEIEEKKLDNAWIENMKYMRDTSKEEYDFIGDTLGETFWNDFTLPADCCSNDFDYAD